MAKILECAKVDPSSGCKHVVRGETVEEVLQKAGEHAKEAGAKRVVITHISDELGDDWAREEAERGFGGSVEIAHEWAEYEV